MCTLSTVLGGKLSSVEPNLLLCQCSHALESLTYSKQHRASQIPLQLSQEVRIEHRLKRNTCSILEAAPSIGLPFKLNQKKRGRDYIQEICKCLESLY